MTAPRSIALLALLLTVVSGLGYLTSRTMVARPVAERAVYPAYVSASAPVGQAPRVAPGLPVRAAQVDPGWLSLTSRRTGIPATALRAYADAQISDAGGCDVGWTTLAGIGWVESQHGTLGGRTLRPSGRSSTPILGPALDGRGDVAAIRSSAVSRAWHGDATWEHAVGTMQFLPSTWASWAADGDGDGRSSPLDLDDAAAATARYLCAAGQDLATGSGWAAAVLSYNHAQAYVDAVHAAAVTYAERTAT